MYPDISFEDIIRHLTVGVIVTDAQGIIRYLNKQAAALLDRTDRQNIGIFISDLLPPAGPRVMKCLEKGVSQDALLINGNKSDLWVDISMMQSDRQIQGAVCCFLPLSKFEHPYPCLNSYEDLNRQLHTILDCSADGIWILDHDMRVINLNKAAEKFNAIRADEIIGKTVTELKAEGLWDRAISPEVIKTKGQVSIYVKTKRTGKFFLYTATPSFDENGNIKHIVVNERDVTQLNTLREQLEHSRMIAEKYSDELAEKNLRDYTSQGIMADDKQMRRVMEAALKLAHIEASNILILGDSGTGKGLLAKFIHLNGKRCKKPFIQINCAALPETLLEAELFGYERGAFTGAREQGKAGLFELAHEGILFLDEIGDMSSSLQAKLLKYLDDQQIIRLGGTTTHEIDCCVIAATNQDLEALVRAGRFRQDLYYRLNAFTIKVPPLRQRPADILELLNYYLDKFNRQYHQNKRISRIGFEALLAYPFPGNVRELKNILKQAVVMSDRDLLDEFIIANIGAAERQFKPSDIEDMPRGSLPAAVEAVEREMLIKAKQQCRTTRAMAAFLNVSHATVIRKMQKYGISGTSGRL